MPVPLIGWLGVGAVVVLGAWARLAGPGTSRTKPLRVLGKCRPPYVLLFGRTGAGKTSLINALGKECFATGPNRSTTRDLRCVPVKIGDVDMTLVDTPGIGGALTSAEYRGHVVRWYRENKDHVDLLVLVLQADSRAHAEDKKMLDELRREKSCSVLVALNQVDKIYPVRDWSPPYALGGEKSEGDSEKLKNIREKITVVNEQFPDVVGVVPVCAKPDRLYNIQELGDRLELKVVSVSKAA